MAEVNDEVNNDKVDNENLQVREIMPARNNDKVEGEEQEDEQVDEILSESNEKISETVLNKVMHDKVTKEKVHEVDLTDGNVTGELNKNNNYRGYGQEAEGETSNLNRFGEGSEVGKDVKVNESKHKIFKCCADNFCELVSRRKERNEKLTRRQIEISNRLATLETWLPMVTFNRVMKGDVDPQNIVKCIEEQAAIMSSVTVNANKRKREGAHEIGGLEAERKEALRKHDEARKVLHEKQLELKKVNEQIEDAGRKQEELQRMIDEEEKNYEENSKPGIGGGSKSESQYSFCSDDLEYLTKLEEFIIGERKIKKELEELEAKEAVYMKILKASEESWKENAGKPKKGLDVDGNAGSAALNVDVDKLRGQLEVKSSANQQLADRICQLEDQIENLESKLRNCNHQIIEFSEKHKTELEMAAKLGEKMKTNGTGDSEISVRDKATLARVNTTDTSSGSRMKIRTSGSGSSRKRMKDKSVNAIVGTSSKNTLARIQVTDRAVQDPISVNPSLGKTSRTADEKSIGNKKMTIQETYVYSSFTSSAGEDSKFNRDPDNETGEETVKRITTFDGAQTSKSTLSSRRDNESSPRVDGSRSYDKTLQDDSHGSDNNRTKEMDSVGSSKRSSTHSQNEKFDALVFGNPESLLDDSFTSKSARLDLSTVSELEERNDKSINEESTLYERELPFGEAQKNGDPENNDSFVSLRSQLTKDQTNYDFPDISDTTNDQSTRYGLMPSEQIDDELLLSLKSRLSNETVGTGDSPDDQSQTHYGSIRFLEAGKDAGQPGADDQLFVSLKSRLSKEETDYSFSGIAGDIVDPIDQNQSKSSSVRFKKAQENYEPGADDQLFVSLKSRLSKEETDYNFGDGDIVVHKKELESWLRSLQSTLSITSKCKEFDIKKPEVIKIIEAISRHLGIESVSDDGKETIPATGNAVTKTTAQTNEIQAPPHGMDEYQTQEVIAAKPIYLEDKSKDSLIKKERSKPPNLELQRDSALYIDEQAEMKMIKDYVGLPSAASTPVEKEFKQTEPVHGNVGIDSATSIQPSVSKQSSWNTRDQEAVRSASINEKSMDLEENKQSKVRVILPDDGDKSREKYVNAATNTITEITMNTVDGDRRDVGTLAVPSLANESQSDEPDGTLLLNDNTQQHKHQNQDETNNSGAASIVLPSTLDTISEPQGITTTTTSKITIGTTTATATATASAGTSTSNLSVRGEGKAGAKGHEKKVLTADPMPEGEIFKDIEKTVGIKYRTKMNSSESERALRSGDVNRKIDETGSWKDRDRARKDDLKKKMMESREMKDFEDDEQEGEWEDQLKRMEKLAEDKGRKGGKKFYENKETHMKEPDGSSDRVKFRRNFIDKYPIAVGQTGHFCDEKLSVSPKNTCCICHETRQGSQHLNLVISKYSQAVKPARQKLPAQGNPLRALKPPKSDTKSPKVTQISAVKYAIATHVAAVLPRHRLEIYSNINQSLARRARGLTTTKLCAGRDRNTYRTLASV
ncbi:uncharacterized protein LOC130678661 isoform X2 [Microplitis mediator]|uniref:uncharacterized protein LOC130678661 isoform X2 n=1 Tax=Microplitis mediator TaxID=375433 RepID=UPI0025566F90|nr:uncharacterized protein LOC130678661 isoform X2 [Microplitis mediator]